MKTLLKSLIVLQVEYACIVWSPTDTAHIKLLESVQRKFTSRFARFQTYNEALGMPVCTTIYSDRLTQLKLFSLERRRERYMILYVYKVIIGLVINPGLTIEYDPRRKIRVTPKTAARNVTGWIRVARDSSFFCQGPKLFNSLPHQLRELENIAVPSKI